MSNNEETLTPEDEQYVRDMIALIRQDEWPDNDAIEEFVEWMIHNTNGMSVVVDGVEVVAWVDKEEVIQYHAIVGLRDPHRITYDDIVCAENVTNYGILDYVRD